MAEQIAIAAACDAGAEVRRWYGHRLDVEAKTTAIDLVTRVDRTCESIIQGSLRKRFPDHWLLGEETGWSAGAAGQPVWLVDPLDGTSNFVHGVPFFAISLALMVEQKLAVGIVYDPLSDELFTAVRNGGAYLNGRRIRVDDQAGLATSFLATRTPAAGERVENMGNLARVVPRCRGVRSLGAAALEMAYVAAGRLTGFWELRLNAWDVAAATLLIQEAGGRVTRVDGSTPQLEQGSIVATNGHVHDELLGFLSLDDEVRPAQRLS